MFIVYVIMIQNILPQTILVRSGITNKALTKMRELRISEALEWEMGTLEEPLKHIVDLLPNGMEVFFLKPGKETARKNPNIHDMTPKVGESTNYNFQDLWERISAVAMRDFEDFKMLLVFIYRNTFFLDHTSVDGKIRYRPSGRVYESLMNLEERIGDILPFGLYGFLNYLDILGWNEDVKYHSENDRPTFTGKYDYKVGRINNMLSCIRVPYQTCSFVNQVIDNRDSRETTDFYRLYSIMQEFSRTRGICPATNMQLIEWLGQYIVDSKNKKQTRKNHYTRPFPDIDGR